MKKNSIQFSSKNKIGIAYKRKIICENPNTDKIFNLVASHIQLFQLIAYQGFLTLQQMDRYYEMITKEHKHISKHTLSTWSSPKSGLLSKVTKEHHNMYRLKTWMKDWLINNGFLDKKDIGIRNRNIHNLLLNESICNGIYQSWKNLIDSSLYGKKEKCVENGFALLAMARNSKNKVIIDQITSYYKPGMELDINLLEVNNKLPNWLYGLDIRTYNRQLNITEEQAQQLTLKPDALIKYGNIPTYIEIDNRNENNYVLVEKIMNYIVHASKHPDIQMNLLFIFNDGSFKNDRITKYKLPISKLSTLVKAMVSEMMYFKGETIQVFKAYQAVKNLHIYLSPLKESYIDFIDILQNATPGKKAKSALNYWAKELRNSIHVLCSKTKIESKNRYLINRTSGEFILSNSTQKSPKINFIFGQEHLVDTTISILMSFYEAKETHKAPIIVYPRRKKAITPLISSNLINKKLSSHKNYQFHNIAIIQQTPESLYDKPFVKLLNHSLSEKQIEIPINLELFK